MNDKKRGVSHGGNLLEIIQAMREFDPVMEVQAVAVFFCVGLHQSEEGISMQDLGDKLDIAQSSVSRNVFKLSLVNRHRERGVDLLESYEDPMERRRKLVKLTNKGKRVYDRLSELVK